MLAKLLGASLVLSIGMIAPATAVLPPPIFVGGEFIREHAIQDDRGHLLVPVRGVFEAFHASVTYTPPRFVVVRKNGAVIAGLIVGRRHALVGSSPRNLPAAPIRRNGRVYVPLRIIAEIAGANVIYSPKPRLVDIRLPHNELTVNAPANGPVETPPEPVTPPWGYALVGASLLAFVLELGRRLVAVARTRPAKRASRYALMPSVSGALQIAHTADAGDHHGIGQVTK